MSELYYLQDKRTYVGNDILWWAKNGFGYTTDLSQAETYTKDEALSQHRSRETDIPWPKEYVDSKIRPSIDMQDVDINEALIGTGIDLIKPAKPKKEAYRCFHCGIFMTQEQFYAADCYKCGGDNSP